MGGQIPRREAIRAGLAAMVGPASLAMARPPAREVRAFRLVEAAGLRRFGYPVHTLVPDASGGRNFRLIRDGRAIPAQFREFPGPDGRPQVGLDFVASPGPLDSSRYEVQFGPDVEPGPEPGEGLSLRERDGRFLVSLGNGSMTLEIDKETQPWLRSVGSPRLGYLGEAGGTFRVRKRGDAGSAIVGDGASLGLVVTRHGPLAVGLRSARTGPDPAGLQLALTIPSSKTWVEVVGTVDDPSGQVAGLEFALDLRVEGSPTLVDLGAGSTVYGQIQGQERMELVAGRASGEAEPEAGSGWVVRKGAGSSPPVTASSTPGSPRPAEGWAHVMDSRRCSAIAIADFGRKGARDRIAIEAGGRVRLTRDFSAGEGEPPRGPKTLALWLHFVPMPVQVGAATSPQSILAPLRVEWDRPPGP